MTLCGKQRRNDSPIFAHLSLPDIPAALCQGWALVAKYTALTSCKDTHKPHIGNYSDCEQTVRFRSYDSLSDLVTYCPISPEVPGKEADGDDGSNQH